MTQRKTIVGTMVMLAALASALLASPAQASGGGCNDITQNGWHLGVCSSDNGVTMYPDYYINAAPSWSGSCTSKSRWEIWQNGSIVGYSSWANAGCARGHYTRNGVSIEGRSSSLEFRTRVQISLNGSTVYNGVGPATRCC
ncbi:hypothetical protein [Longispora urticae]